MSPRPRFLELGTFKDFDKLFDALSLAVDHVEDWEAELVPVDDDYADFDDCGDDEFGEDFADGDANE